MASAVFDTSQFGIPEFAVEGRVMGNQRDVADEVRHLAHNNCRRGAERIIVSEIPIRDSMNDGIRTPAFIRL